MGSLLRDLRYSCRLFLQNPGFIAVAVLSLAMGIGANTTIFSVLNTVLLQPFPVKEPERLAVLFERNLQQKDMRVPTFAAFQEWKKQTQVFEDMALTGMGGDPATLTGAKEAVRISFESVGTNFFPVVGIGPALGRTFLPEDSQPGYGRALVLSHGFWQRQYGGDQDIIGQTVVVEGMKMTIIGVMPRGFWLFPWANDTDAWCTFDPGKNSDSRWLTPIGRLRPGATLDQAQAEFEILFRRLAQEQPDVYKGWDIRVESLHEWAVGGSRSNLYLLLGAVGFVLLIACANVANLLLARASARRKEIAVRSCVGAGRLRLIRQLLTESLLLSLAGGLFGVLVAVWGIRLFIALAPEWSPRTAEITIDRTVLGFTLLLSLLTGLVFGLAPALQASRPDLNESLKEAGGRSTGGSGGRGRSLLVVTEVALALVLLMGAGLMINSFMRLQNVDLGFDPKHILKADIFLAGPKYWNQLEGEMKRVTPQGDLFFQRMVERAEHLPGVVSAGIGSLERMPSHPFRIVGTPPQAAKDQPQATFAEVSPGYFRTMGIPLLKGRTLSDRDVAGAPWVIVVSESFARRFFPNEDPIGKLLYLTVRVESVNRSMEEDRPREVVGVVRDVRYWGPRYETPLVIYGSYLQHPWEYPGGYYSFHLWTKLVLRTATDPTSLAAPVQRIVAELDKDQVVFDVMPLERMISTFVAPQRFWMQLFGIFGGLAVFLAVVGIYGVMSYSVARRTHEIGIRMTTGAQRRDILKLVVGHGLKLALIGVAIGIGGSLALTRLLAQYLYEVKPTDPLTLVVVAIVLTAVALGASYIPARRAMKVDPVVALRYQ
jgi:putative ABC transport system permease protein